MKLEIVSLYKITSAIFNLFCVRGLRLLKLHNSSKHFFRILSIFSTCFSSVGPLRSRFNNYASSPSFPSILCSHRNPTACCSLGKQSSTALQKLQKFSTLSAEELRSSFVAFVVKHLYTRLNRMFVLSHLLPPSRWIVGRKMAVPKFIEPRLPPR